MRNDQQSNVWAPYVQKEIAGVWNQVGELLKEEQPCPTIIMWIRPRIGLGPFDKATNTHRKIFCASCRSGAKREIYIYISDVSYGYKWNTASLGPAIHIGLPLRVSEDLLQKAWKRGGSNLRFPSCPVQMKVKFSRIRIHRKRKREKHT